MGCRICDYPIYDIHHIIPKRYGGTDDESNHVKLCPNHHRAFHKLLSGIIYRHTRNFFKNTAAYVKEDVDLEITMDYIVENEKELCNFFEQHSKQIFDAVTRYYDNKR